MSEARPAFRVEAGPLVIDLLWVSVAFGVAALGIGSAFLLAIALAIALPFLWSAARPIAASPFDLHLELQWPREPPFSAGDLRPLRLLVSHQGKSAIQIESIHFHTSPWLSVSSTGSHRPIPPGEQAVVTFDVHGLGFGLAQIHSASVSYTQTPGWQRVHALLPLHEPITVLPARVNCPPTLDPGSHLDGSLERHPTDSPDSSRTGLDLHNLQEHGPGDDLRHLAWRASLRHQRLVTQRFAKESALGALVLLDTGPLFHAAPLGDAPIDRIASGGAAISARLLRQGVPVSVALLHPGAAPPGPAEGASRGQAGAVSSLLAARHVGCPPEAIADPSIIRQLADCMVLRGHRRPFTLQDAFECMGPDGGDAPLTTASGWARRLDQWCLAHGVALRPPRDASNTQFKRVNSLESILQTPGWGRILLVTDLAVPLRPELMFERARRLRMRGVEFEIIDCPAPPPTHHPISNDSHARDQRVEACLQEERMARSADLARKLRSHAIPVHACSP